MVVAMKQRDGEESPAWLNHCRVEVGGGCGGDGKQTTFCRGLLWALLAGIGDVERNNDKERLSSSR